jgi:hypothetical protein
LIGLLVGAGLAMFGTYYAEWLRDRQDRVKVGAELVAKARVLLRDSTPGLLTFLVLKDETESVTVADIEKGQQGEVLMEQYRELRLPFLEFVVAHPWRRVQVFGEGALEWLGYAVSSYGKAEAADADEKERAEGIAADVVKAATERLDAFEEELANVPWRKR